MGDESSGLGITSPVWFEVLDGARSKAELNRAVQVLVRFEQVEFSLTDLRIGLWLLAQFGPSHQIEAFDCMIAATAYCTQLPIYTRNLRDFTPMLGALAQKPY